MSNYEIFSYLYCAFSRALVFCKTEPGEQLARNEYIATSGISQILKTFVKSRKKLIVRSYETQMNTSYRPQAAQSGAHLTHCPPQPERPKLEFKWKYQVVQII